MAGLTPRSLATRVVGLAVSGTLLIAVVAFLVALGTTRQAAPIVPGVVAPPPPASLAAAAVAPPATGAASVVSADWVAGTAAAAGIPEPAVRAYGAATLRIARSDPSCGLGWTTLAGLGWVESEHGTIGGRVLEASGRPDRPISGPALDGRGAVAAIRSATGRWERAIGPLQFLPSTWRDWASDGDRDGRRDPQDVDDAALAAGRYLCASGLDLRTGVGWSAAIRSYNHSDAYVRAVYDAASAYAVRTAAPGK